MSQSDIPSMWAGSLTDGTLTPRYIRRHPVKAARQWFAQARFGCNELSRDPRVLPPEEMADVFERFTGGDNPLHSICGRLLASTPARCAQSCVCLNVVSICEQFSKV